MTIESRNNAGKTPRRNAGRPFAKGNPGRPKGARHRATMAAEALLDGEAQALTRTAIEKAKEGDSVALRLCLERIVPPRKDRPVRFDLPPLKNAEDAAGAMAAIAAAVAAGDLTLAEAAEASRIVESFVRAIEAGDITRRLLALEEAAESAAQR